MSAVLLLTAAAIVLILPGERARLLGRLVPVARSGSLVLRSVRVANDHGEWRLTTALRLENPGESTVHPLGSPPALRLEAADGSRAAPATLPGRTLPEALTALEPGAQWEGELGWWLTPEQGAQPLTLHWLDQQVSLPAPAAGNATGREAERE